MSPYYSNFNNSPISTQQMLGWETLDELKKYPSSPINIHKGIYDMRPLNFKSDFFNIDLNNNSQQENNNSSATSYYPYDNTNSIVGRGLTSASAIAGAYASSSNSNESLKNGIREAGYQGLNFIPVWGPIISAAARTMDAVGKPVYEKLSNGYTGGIGTKIHDIQGYIPGGIGDLGLTATTALLNRAYGSKVNDEFVNKKNTDINNAIGWSSKSTDYSSLAADLAGVPNLKNFTKRQVGKDGWFANRVDNMYKNMRGRFNYAQENIGDKISDRVQSIANRRTSDMAKNYYNNYALGGNLYADGGDLFNYGLDFTNGLQYVNTGDTHENNPHQGVAVSINQQDGQPNLVEEGEVIANGDYVFSNRLKVPDSDAKVIGIPRGKTYADAMKYLSKESEEMPNDPIIKRGLQDAINKLQNSQEQLKQQQQEEEQAMQAILSGQYADGGIINIKEANRGLFTKAAKKAGMSTQEYANHILANKDNYSTQQVRRANFAHNAAGWEHALGGHVFADGSEIPPLIQVGDDWGYRHNGLFTPLNGYTYLDPETQDIMIHGDNPYLAKKDGIIMTKDIAEQEPATIVEELPYYATREMINNWGEDKLKEMGYIQPAGYAGVWVNPKKQDPTVQALTKGPISFMKYAINGIATDPNSPFYRDRSLVNTVIGAGIQNFIKKPMQLLSDVSGDKTTLLNAPIKVSNWLTQNTIGDDAIDLAVDYASGKATGPLLKAAAPYISKGLKYTYDFGKNNVNKLFPEITPKISLATPDGNMLRVPNVKSESKSFFEFSSKRGKKKRIKEIEDAGEPRLNENLQTDVTKDNFSKENQNFVTVTKNKKGKVTVKAKTNVNDNNLENAINFIADKEFENLNLNQQMKFKRDVRRTINSMKKSDTKKTVKIANEMMEKYAVATGSNRMGRMTADYLGWIPRVGGNKNFQRVAVPLYLSALGDKLLNDGNGIQNIADFLSNVRNIWNNPSNDQIREAAIKKQMETNKELRSSQPISPELASELSKYGIDPSILNRDNDVEWTYFNDAGFFSPDYIWGLPAEDRKNFQKWKTPTGNVYRPTLSVDGTDLEEKYYEDYRKWKKEHNYTKSGLYIKDKDGKFVHVDDAASSFYKNVNDPKKYSQMEQLHEALLQRNPGEKEAYLRVMGFDPELLDVYEFINNNSNSQTDTPEPVPAQLPQTTRQPQNVNDSPINVESLFNENSFQNINAWGGKLYNHLYDGNSEETGYTYTADNDAEWDFTKWYNPFDYGDAYDNTDWINKGYSRNKNWDGETPIYWDTYKNALLNNSALLQDYINFYVKDVPELNDKLYKNGTLNKEAATEWLNKVFSGTHNFNDLDKSKKAWGRGARMRSKVGKRYKLEDGTWIDPKTIRQYDIIDNGTEQPLDKNAGVTWTDYVVRKKNSLTNTPTNNPTTPEEKDEKDEKEKILREYQPYVDESLRYAPLGINAMSLINNMRPVDYSTADAYDRYAQEMGNPVSIPVNTISNYRRRNPFDESYFANIANQNNAANARTGYNIAGGNRAMQMGYQSARDYATLQQLGQLANTAYQANRQDDSDVATFNKATDASNAEMINSRNQYLANLNSQRDLASKQALINSAIYRQGLRDERDKAIAADLANLSENLSGLGQEARAENARRWLYNAGVLAPTYDMLRSDKSKQNIKMKKESDDKSTKKNQNNESLIQDLLGGGNEEKDKKENKENFTINNLADIRSLFSGINVDEYGRIYSTLKNRSDKQRDKILHSLGHYPNKNFYM